MERSDHLVDDLFQKKQFYEVFSNIEHLKFEYGRGQEFLFSLNRLPKLSTLNVKWKTEGYPTRYDYDIELNTDRYEIKTCMWFGNNMS
jgi:hypothetical protein